MENRIEIIRQAAKNKNIYIDYCSKYGEFGYKLSEGKKAILFSDWNKFEKYPRIMEWIEENYEIEWCDEWVIDYNNDKCYRKIHNSYGWQPSMYMDNNGNIIPYDDINEMNEEEFKEFLIENNFLNNPKTAIDLVRFEPKGELIGEDKSRMLESKPDPKKMLELAKEKYPENDFYFVIDSVNQFGFEFVLYKI
jgi:hypothetical protein